MFWAGFILGMVSGVLMLLCTVVAVCVVMSAGKYSRRRQDTGRDYDHLRPKGNTASVERLLRCKGRTLSSRIVNSAERN